MHREKEHWDMLASAFQIDLTKSESNARREMYTRA